MVASNASGLRDGLELEEQARFAYPRLAHRRDDLATALAAEFKRVLHLLQFGLPADELRQPAPPPASACAAAPVHLPQRH